MGTTESTSCCYLHYDLRSMAIDIFAKFAKLVKTKKKIRK